MGRIELQFSRQYDLESAAIAWFTQGKFSHVDAVLPDDSLTGARSDVVHVNGETIPAGVQNRPKLYAHWKYTTVLWIDVTNAQERLFYGFVQSQIGKPYDKADIWEIIVNGRDRDWQAVDSWICSELITVALEKALVFRPALVSASKIAPDPLYFACSIAGFQAAA